MQRTPLALCTLALLTLAACATTSAGPAATPAPAALSSGNAMPFVYVSGYRPEIGIYRLDHAAARLEKVGQADGGEAPSFLAFSPGAKFLYAANEVDDGKVTAFAVDATSGALTRLNDASSGGFGPAHLALDRTGRWVLTANYADTKPGTIAVLPVSSDGKVGAPVAKFDFGPGTMPHYITTDPSNRFVYVPCKGGPYIGQFRFDAATGALTPLDPPRVASARDAGPRHLAFHPNGRYAYVINELNMTVTAYTLDANTGALRELETVPTIPADVTDRKGFSTAEVEVHPSGQWLYGSNRGYDSIVQMQIDQNTGRLRPLGQERREIKKPRHFQIDPSGRILLVANQDGASVTVFRIDATSGKLDLAGPPVPVGPGPSYAGVAPLGGP